MVTAWLGSLSVTEYHRNCGPKKRASCTLSLRLTASPSTRVNSRRWLRSQLAKASSMAVANWANKWLREIAKIRRGRGQSIWPWPAIRSTRIDSHDLAISPCRLSDRREVRLPPHVLGPSIASHPTQARIDFRLANHGGRSPTGVLARGCHCGQRAAPAAGSHLLCSDSRGLGIYLSYLYKPELVMKAKVAKLFTNGGSQAVRLPAEFRFEGDEVFIRHDPVTGDVILSRNPNWSTWQEFLAIRDAAEVPADFLDERSGNQPLVMRDPFGGAR